MDEMQNKAEAGSWGLAELGNVKNKDASKTEVVENKDLLLCNTLCCTLHFCGIFRCDEQLKK